MKKISKLLCIVLAVLMLAAAVVGCHKKNEIAFTVGDTQFTSAFYSCMLYVSATNAKADIDAFIEENKIEVAEDQEVNYPAYKFDAEGKVSATGTVSYDMFVRDDAIRILRQYATLDSWMKAKNYTLDENTKKNAQNEAFCQWYYGCSVYYYNYYTSQGYDPSSIFTPTGAILEENGVAYTTFEKYMMYEATYNFYFEKLYGKDGEKAVPDAELTDHMVKHYTVADSLSFSKKDSDNKDLTEEKLKELKALADKYAERLNNGEKFEDIYKEEQKRLEEEEKKNNTSSGSSTTSDTSSAASSTSTSSEATSSTGSAASAESTGSASSNTSSNKDEGYKPPEYLGIYGDEDSSYSHTMFSEVVKQELGKAVVLEDKENSQYLLVVRHDMTDKVYENYWLDNLRSAILSEMKTDEFEKLLDDSGKTLALSEDTHATEPFTVEKIVFAVEEQ